MKIEIKRGDTEKIIICGEYESVKDALEKNKDKGFRAYLRGADLQGADLQGAYLQGADLQGAYLRGADLQGAYLRGADLQGADLQGAYLRGAHLQGADLRGADLQGADLRGAYLQGADLRGAYLQGAYLQGADLQGAYLRGADRFRFLPDLHILKMQNCKLKAWKYLINGKSPYQNSEYKVGEIYKFEDIDKSELETCGQGGNVATLQWCLKDSTGNNADEFIEVEFESKDIVMPICTDGKFRVSEFKVLRQINRKEAIKLLKEVK